MNKNDRRALLAFIVVLVLALVLLVAGFTARADAARIRPHHVQQPTLTVVGDSIALGFGSYLSVPGVDVENKAISGTCLRVRPNDPFCVPDLPLLKRLRALDPGPGDMVLISIGTNDLPSGVRADEMIADYQRVITFMNRSGARYWFATITPFERGDDWRAGFNPTRVKVNRWLVDHAGAIDTTAPIGGAYLNPRYSLDGLHLTPQGSTRVARLVARTVTHP